MLKTILNMLCGALITAAVASAFAVTGNVPQPGFQAIDGTWLLGLSGGTNYTYQYGITAAGTSQTTATPLPANIYMVETDTVGSGTGVNLPTCIPGSQLILYNNGASTLAVFPAVANNPATGAQDTIGGFTSLNNGSGLTTKTQIAFACIKAGVWSAS